MSTNRKVMDTRKVQGYISISDHFCIELAQRGPIWLVKGPVQVAVLDTVHLVLYN